MIHTTEDLSEKNTTLLASALLAWVAIWSETRTEGLKLSWFTQTLLQRPRDLSAGVTTNLTVNLKWNIKSLNTNLTRMPTTTEILRITYRWRPQASRPSTLTTGSAYPMKNSKTWVYANKEKLSKSVLKKSSLRTELNAGCIAWFTQSQLTLQLTQRYTSRRLKWTCKGWLTNNYKPLLHPMHI